jgi:hypothetical protein
VEAHVAVGDEPVVVAGFRKVALGPIFRNSFYL